MGQKPYKEMIDIIKIVEEDLEFVAVVEKVLRHVCKHFSFQRASLRQRKSKGDKWVTLCYCGKGPELLPTEADGLVFVEEEYKVVDTDVFLSIEVQGHKNMQVAFYEYTGELDIEEMAQLLIQVCFMLQKNLEKRIIQNSLAGSYSSLEEIISHVGCGVYVHDPVTKDCLYVNQYYKDNFRGSTLYRELEHLLSSGCERTEYFASEENRWFDVSKSNIPWANGKEAVLYTITEITEKKLYQQKSDRQLNNDLLTGLYNRMRCEQDLEHYINQTKEFGEQGALLYLDLDDFKHINDGLGHQYGDALLRAISHSLQRISGIESSCYRMGGDEFIIIVPPSHYNMLNAILENISNIFKEPWFLKGADYYCTMSMGIARFPADAQTGEDLIKKADMALYEAKKTGKNRIEYYNNAVESADFNRLDLSEKMRTASQNASREFDVFFQPIMEMDGTCIGAEALIRWKLEGIGFVSPAEFIPMAEYLGLINPIGEYVLTEACQHLKRWNDMGHPNYRMHVNLSVVQLLQNDIVKKVEKVIRECRIRPENLVLEVTESLAVNDMNRMKQILAQMKDIGVMVAMDNFGTGYSSLNHIREVPLDIIKIDRCFVKDIDKDEFSESFIKTVAELAKTVGITVCVEGVEEREQYEILSHMKVQQLQGFFYDKPMTAGQFEEKYL